METLRDVLAGIGGFTVITSLGLLLGFLANRPAVVRPEPPAAAEPDALALAAGVAAARWAEHDRREAWRREVRRRLSGEDD